MAKHFLYVGPIIEVWCAKPEEVDNFLKNHGFNDKWKIFYGTSKFVPIVPLENTAWSKEFSIKSKSHAHIDLEDTEKQEKEFEKEHEFFIEELCDEFQINNVIVRFGLMKEIRI